MQAQVRLLVILFTCFVVAIVALVGSAPEESDEPQVVHPFADLPLSAVQSVTITTGEQSLVVSQQDQGWSIDAPITAKVDPNAMRQLLEMIPRMGLGPTLGQQGDFGLQTEVTLKDHEGVNLGTFWVGRNTPVGQRTYIQLPGDGVRASQTPLREAFSVDPSRLRTREILSVDPQAVTRVSLDGTELIQENGTWWVGSHRADLYKVLGLTGALTSIKADAFPEDWGAVEERREVTLVSLQGQLDLQIDLTKDGRWRVVGPLAPGGVEVFRSPLDGVPSEPERWTDAVLLRAPKDISAVEVVWMDQTFQAQRIGGQWSSDWADPVIAAVHDCGVDRSRSSDKGAAVGSLQFSNPEGDQVVHLFEADHGEWTAADTAEGPGFILTGGQWDRVIAALPGE